VFGFGANTFTISGAWERENDYDNEIAMARKAFHGGLIQLIRELFLSERSYDSEADRAPRSTPSDSGLGLL
ncbi:hypothetical protein, partial [uncultured Lamprocystis sp.]|uniref:hypothetical protein n=1 Tax=uncultured Lamprocystis sp. TaxID=543132 RepID=UPI0025D80449